jgi:hypothetical protein
MKYVLFLYYNQVQMVMSTRNRQACVKNLMKLKKAKGVCKDRTKWKETGVIQRISNKYGSVTALKQ